jgi:hypothetical protein
MARKPAETVQLKLRFSEALRRQLERKAKDNDQSMNTEIVQRLERSFQVHKLMVEALALTYGQELAGILFEVGEAMKAAGEQAAFFSIGMPSGFDDVFALSQAARTAFQNWFDDPYAFSQAAQAAAEVVARNKPDGEPVLPYVADLVPRDPRLPKREEELGRLGRDIAKTIITEAASGLSKTKVERAQFLHRNSGRLARRLQKFCSENKDAPTHLGGDQ